MTTTATVPGSAIGSAPAPAPVERTTADLVLEWDRARPRSQQRDLGWSEVGGCRRRAGYRLAGIEPSDMGGSVQAALGAMIHDAIAEVLRRTAAPGDLVEHRVTFAGIPGTLDRYEASTATLVDVKTTSSRRLEWLRLHGPTRDHLWQVNGYAAALIRQGRPVRRLVIDYITRDTGELWRWVGRPNPQHVRDALAWLRQVRQADLDILPRDYEPDSAHCSHCPFRSRCWDGAVPDRDPRSVLYREHPDAAHWVAQLEQARALRKQAEQLERAARGALDALRPSTSGTVDVGLPDRLLRWRVTTSARLNTARVRADYAAAGATPPTTTTQTVRLELIPKTTGGDPTHDQ